MDIHNLVHMANRIGEFFQAMPDRQEAVEGTAQHLRKFWEPRMRQMLLEHVATHGSQGLHPLVAETLAARAATIR